MYFVIHKIFMCAVVYNIYNVIYTQSTNTFIYFVELKQSFDISCERKWNEYDTEVIFFRFFFNEHFFSLFLFDLLFFVRVCMPGLAGTHFFLFCTERKSRIPFQCWIFKWFLIIRCAFLYVSVPLFTQYECGLFCRSIELYIILLVCNK